MNYLVKRRLFYRTTHTRHRAELQPAAYSANGVLHSSTPVDYDSDDTLNVGIIASSWPAWAISFMHPRFKLQWIVILDESIIELIRKCFPTILVLSGKDIDLSRLATTDIVGYNGPMTQIKFPPSFGSIYLFDWNVRLKNWHQWTITTHKYNHSTCGGVSDFHAVIKIAIITSMNDIFHLPDIIIGQYPASTLSSILEHTENGVEVNTAPRLPRLTVPKVSKVSHGCYHPNGLFPITELEPTFLIPCVFVTSRWVKRKLSTKELLGVYDVPISIIKLLSGTQRRQLTKITTTPIKCLTAILHEIFLSGTVGFSEGGKVGVSLNGDNIASSNKVNIPTSPRKFNNVELLNTHGSEENVGAWISNLKHNKDEKAAKNDDAEVPIHFWNDSLALKLNLPNLTRTQEDALVKLREFSVTRIWTRRVTRCFCCYLRCKSCHLKQMKQMFQHDAIKQIISCKRCKQHLGIRAKDKCTIWQGGKYVWMKKEGRKKYKRWYNMYRKKAIKAEATEIELDIEVGVDCIKRATACTPWSWNLGSRLFFWRWGEFIEEARDGTKIFVQGKLPQCNKKQKVPKIKKTLELVQSKLLDVRRKGYISKGPVRSVTSFFDVPKGDDDIRLVYNATESGLNEAVWAPWFSLPTCESHLRSVDPGTYMGDADLGEMFLNFTLDKNIRMYAGVDFSLLFADEWKEGETFWERWERMLMGFRPSPYCTTRDMRRIDLFLRGAADDPNNVFRWSKVVLNLPGKETYTSTRPRVFRVRADGVMAADLFSYIDDLRNTGPTAPECWDGLHQVCCRLCWLGLQDAPRKRNSPSLTPRAWAGSILHTDQDLVTVLVSEEKWAKTKNWIVWVLTHCEMKEGLPYKELLSCRGFLIYVSRTYGPFKPYLRGLHKTIDSWRPYRDKEGWKVMASIIEAKLSGDDEAIRASHNEPTKFILPLKRLKSDFCKLKNLTKAEAPPKVIRRRNKTGSAAYGFGDSSGQGFGNAIEVEGEIHSEFGQWCSELESKHSNYKELRNLVNAVENAYSKGLLKGCELFLFTDNFVAECGYYNGGSNRSKDLDELVHRLWKLQMGGDFTLHVYHIAGTRMIESGIDGLSRGDKSEGIAKGMKILKFIPIHLNGMERSPKLISWIRSWWNIELGELHLMTPEDWFLKVMDTGNFLWMVAPAAGEAAVEQLCIHIHGRPDTHHIFVIPRLCTCSWRKQLLKACDLVLTIQPKFDFWNTNMHEPLIVGIYFPLLPPETRFKPWQLKYTTFVERFKSNLHRMQTASEPMDWNILREFLSQARSIPSLPHGLARELLQVTDRNIQLRDPRFDSRQDINMMKAIRRANIDAFWGRSSSTVRSNKSNLKRLVNIAYDDYGMNKPLPEMGPHELNDSWGMGLAIILLRKSLDKGIHGPTVQFETARRLRSSYSNLWGASRHALTLGVMAKDTRKTFVTKCPGYCLWFERFIRGMHSRMGDIKKQDAAISSLVMHAVMDRVEVDFVDADSEIERRYIVRCGLYFLAGYLGSLRGEETPRILLKYFLSLNAEAMESRTRHCVLPLYGNFKNDGGIARAYLFRIVCRSKSGFDMEKWVRRAMHYEADSKTAFLFAFENGKKENGQIYEPYFFTKLLSVQKEERGLLPRKLDIEDAFGVSRSFRRGSVTAAGNAPNDECDDKDISRNNRWRTEDKAGTKSAGLNMLQLYTDTLHSVKADLKFSACL